MSALREEAVDYAHKRLAGAMRDVERWQELVRKGPSERIQRWRALQLEGYTNAQIAADYGVTRQAVSASLRKWFGDVRAEAMKARQQERALGKLLERLGAAKPCRVCGSWVLRGAKFITCSPECAEAWVLARFHLDAEKNERHRRSIARWEIANLDAPRGRPASQVEHAKRVLAGEVKSRGRWVTSPAVAAALKRAGRTDEAKDLSAGRRQEAMT